MRTKDALDHSQSGISHNTEFATNITAGHQVLVFKTNVQQTAQAEKLVDKLKLLYRDCRINFDLTDCDRILRLAGKSVAAQPAIRLLLSEGFTCEILD